jgi:putative transcriptional regulator
MSKQKKRDLFSELRQGIKEIKQFESNQLTLHTHKIEKKPHLQVSATTIRRTREHLRMSRNLFAYKLRVSPRTLEKWEQGITTPNDQAAALILMVKKYPDTLERLEKI